MWHHEAKGRRVAKGSFMSNLYDMGITATLSVLIPDVMLSHHILQVVIRLDSD